MAIGTLLLNDRPVTRLEMFAPVPGDKAMLKEAANKRWQLAFLDELMRLKYIVDEEDGYRFEQFPQLARLLVEVRPLGAPPRSKDPQATALEKILDEGALPSAPGLPTLQQLLWPNDPAPSVLADVGREDAVASPKLGLRSATPDADEPDMLDVIRQMLALTQDQAGIFKKLVDAIFEVRTTAAAINDRLAPYESSFGMIKKRLDEVNKHLTEQSAGAVGQKLQQALSQVTLELSALKGPVQALAAQTSAADVDARLTAMESEVRALRESNERLASVLRMRDQNQMPKLLRRLETFTEEIKSLSELALEAMPQSNSGGPT